MDREIRMVVKGKVITESIMHTFVNILHFYLQTTILFTTITVFICKIDFCIDYPTLKIYFQKEQLAITLSTYIQKQNL